MSEFLMDLGSGSMLSGILGSPGRPEQQHLLDMVRAAGGFGHPFGSPFGEVRFEVLRTPDEGIPESVRALMEQKRRELDACGLSVTDRNKAIRASLRDRGYTTEVREQFMRDFERGPLPAMTAETAAEQERQRISRRERQEAEQQLRPKVEKFFLKTKHSIAWEDLVGNEDARAALVEAIEHPVKHKKLYAQYGKKPTKGVLLYGPPGCGKTMFGKAAASVQASLHGQGRDDHTMLVVNAPSIQSPYVSVTEGVIRDVFAYARAYAKLRGYPMVVFIDEADAILPSRSGGPNRRKALPWEESNVAQFLVEMDGMEESGALVILATNRPDAIDPAILRDGRCDRKIKVERPDAAATQTILERCLAGIPLYGATAEEIAERTAASMFGADAALAILRHANGNEVLTLGHVSSGAMVTGLVEHAKGIAFRRDLASDGSPTGLGHADFEAAVHGAGAEHRHGPLSRRHGDVPGPPVDRARRREAPQGRGMMWDPQPTLESELAKARDALHVQRIVMEILWDERPNARDRLFLREPECPKVLEIADRIEQLEAIVRNLERRIRLAERVAA